MKLFHFQANQIIRINTFSLKPKRNRIFQNENIKMNGCYLHISCLTDREVQADDKNQLAAEAAAVVVAAAAAAGGYGTAPDLLVTERFM